MHPAAPELDSTGGLMRLTIFTVGLFSLGVLACASRPLPTARVSSSEAAVRGAHEVGAEQTPEAALHLQMARDQLARARALMNDGEHEDAEWYLARAESDAEVAIALAREAKAKQAADHATMSVRQAASEAPIPSGQTAPNQ